MITKSLVSIESACSSGVTLPWTKKVNKETLPLRSDTVDWRPGRDST